MFNIIPDSFSCLLQFSYAEVILGTDLHGLKHATNFIGTALCTHISSMQILLQGEALVQVMRHRVIQGLQQILST